MWVLWATLSGAEPTVAFDEAGMLRASTVIAASPDAVKAVLGDAPRVAKWSPEVLSMTPVGAASGACRDFEVTTKGLWNPLSYVVRRCTTDAGFSDRLVSSDDFTRVQADWTVTAVPEGARVDYVGTVDVDLPVPRAALRKAQTGSMTMTLTRLVAEVAGG